MNYKLFFCVGAINLFYYVPNLLALPVVGGREDRFHTLFKYHVSIQYDHNPANSQSGTHFGGGTIIHDRYVLSAAHLFLRINHNGQFERILYPQAHGIAVLSGTSETYGPGIITPVDKIFIPHEYNHEFYADISVLKLSVSLDAEQRGDLLEIKQIDSENHSLDIFDNEYAIIPGNGRDTIVDGQLLARPASRRRFIEVRMMPRTECRQYNYAICSVTPDPSNIRMCCRGDSGSPLVFGNIVIGVVSLGPGEVRYSNTPIVSTRTLTFIDFIRHATDEDDDYYHRTHMYIL